MTIRWFTDGDRAERARIARELRERDELLLTFARWLSDRAGHDGPVIVPDLAPETEARLIRLLREGTAPPTA
ncbi:hypothetical protein ACI782_16305 [Geodermatophilus sp. SYSU D00703]